ncbi:Cys-Gln thioester bond-forming surface protein [Weissella coleopterorum]|uniref:Cys-Gln thioester bond-forming surface protein n=1 Tax=Weissella coleopterorum TaxID=2714949 RepID=A0A6G8AYH4_9LACO|nr:thioester domain-containing protein [Weissella coleopterorum]QIL49933.1 Cys-Gln thioester bond-forming surface protein [Weissella coleopterorum]
MQVLTKKQGRKLKRNFTKPVAVVMLALSMGTTFTPILVSADATVPTISELKTRSINNDKSGFGGLLNQGSEISYYEIADDPAGQKGNGIETRHNAISYGNVMFSSAMFYQGQFAYCLQNTKGDPTLTGGTTWDPNLSAYANELMSVVLILGYPNAPVVNGDLSGMRSYFATQYALWAAESGGNVELQDHSMVSLDSIRDGAGVADGARALYAKAQNIMNNGGLASMTANTHDQSKADAEAKLKNEMTSAVDKQTTELTNKVNSDLASKSTAKTKDMTKYMKGVSDTALGTVKKDMDEKAKNVLADLVKKIQDDKSKPLATMNSSQFEYNDKVDGAHVFTFKTEALMPKLDLGSTDIHTLIKDKTTKLKTKVNYSGTMNTSASGKVVAVTTGDGLNETGDKVDTLSIKLDHELPDGSFIMQDGQKIEAKDNQTYMIKQGVDFEVHIPKEAESDTDKLSYKIVGETALSLADFKAISKTNLSGKEQVKSSASGNASASVDYNYQEGAQIDVIGAGVSPDPANQNVGVFILKAMPVQKSDKVNDSKPVKVDKTKDVKTPYSDTQTLKLDGKSESIRDAEANSSFSWEKAKEAVGQAQQSAVKLAETSAKHPKTVAGVVAGLVALIGGLGLLVFNKLHKSNSNTQK